VYSWHPSLLWSWIPLILLTLSHLDALASGAMCTSQQWGYLSWWQIGHSLVMIWPSFSLCTALCTALHPNIEALLSLVIWIWSNNMQLSNPFCTRTFKERIFPSALGTWMTQVRQILMVLPPYLLSASISPSPSPLTMLLPNRLMLHSLSYFQQEEKSYWLGLMCIVAAESANQISSLFVEL